MNAWDHDDLNEWEQSMYDEFGLSPTVEGGTVGGWYLLSQGDGFDPLSFCLTVDAYEDGTFVVEVQRRLDGRRHKKPLVASVNGRAELDGLLERIISDGDLNGMVEGK